eukprot:SAG11_NODE_1828_length_4196_cov_3.555528_2_plen_450_part_00
MTPLQGIVMIASESDDSWWWMKQLGTTATPGSGPAAVAPAVAAAAPAAADTAGSSATGTTNDDNDRAFVVCDAVAVRGRPCVPLDKVFECEEWHAACADLLSGRTDLFLVPTTFHELTHEPAAPFVLSYRWAKVIAVNCRVRSPGVALSRACRECKLAVDALRGLRTLPPSSCCWVDFLCHLDDPAHKPHVLNKMGQLYCHGVVQPLYLADFTAAVAQGLPDVEGLEESAAAPAATRGSQESAAQAGARRRHARAGRMARSPSPPPPRRAPRARPRRPPSPDLRAAVRSPSPDRPPRQPPAAAALADALRRGWVRPTNRTEPYITPVASPLWHHPCGITPVASPLWHHPCGITPETSRRLMCRVSWPLPTRALCSTGAAGGIVRQARPDLHHAVREGMLCLSLLLDPRYAAPPPSGRHALAPIPGGGGGGGGSWWRRRRRGGARDGEPC